MHLNGRRALVTGAQGMLARDLIPLLENAGADLRLTARESSRETAKETTSGVSDFGSQEVLPLDICDAEAVRSEIEEFSPEYVFNCAAYTAVDLAESERDLAFKVNTMGPANLANALKGSGDGLLVQISTDYVFGGQRGSEKTSEKVPYCEDEPLFPCGIYGYSKYFGEELVRSILPNNNLIVRTSWLFGPHGPNFVATMLRLGREKTELSVVDDQYGAPTSTSWLAEMLVKLVERDARGTYHVSSRGEISWFDFAKEIFNLAEIDLDLKPQSTESAGRLAPRPFYSALSLAKTEKFIGEPCVLWKESVREYLQKLGDLEA